MASGGSAVCSRPPGCPPGPWTLLISPGSDGLGGPIGRLCSLRPALATWLRISPPETLLENLGADCRAQGPKTRGPRKQLVSLIV